MYQLTYISVLGRLPRNFWRIACFWQSNVDESAPDTGTTIYYHPQHPPSSIFMLDSHFPQPLSRSSGLPLGLEPPISYSPHFVTQSLSFFFAKHAHAIGTCFAEVTRLCDLYLISLSAQYLEISFFLNATHPSHNSHLCYLKCHLTFSARCYATWYMLWACVCVCLSQVGVLQDARCRITLTVL